MIDLSDEQLSEADKLAKQYKRKQLARLLVELGDEEKRVRMELAIAQRELETRDRLLSEERIRTNRAREERDDWRKQANDWKEQLDIAQAGILDLIYLVGGNPDSFKGEPLDKMFDAIAKQWATPNELRDKLDEAREERDKLRHKLEQYTTTDCNGDEWTVDVPRLAEDLLVAQRELDARDKQIRNLEAHVDELQRRPTLAEYEHATEARDKLQEELSKLAQWLLDRKLSKQGYSTADRVLDVLNVSGKFAAPASEDRQRLAELDDVVYELTDLAKIVTNDPDNEMRLDELGPAACIELVRQQFREFAAKTEHAIKAKGASWEALLSVHRRVVELYEPGYGVPPVWKGTATETAVADDIVGLVRDNEADWQRTAAKLRGRVKSYRDAIKLLARGKR